MSGPAMLGEPLSARELQIAWLVSEGLTNREVGKELHLAEATIKSHLSRIFAKTGLNTRTALAVEVTGTFRTTAEVVAYLQRRYVEVNSPKHLLGTADWYRQEGRLEILSELIKTFGVPPERPTIPTRSHRA